MTEYGRRLAGMTNNALVAQNNSDTMATIRRANFGGGGARGVLPPAENGYGVPARSTQGGAVCTPKALRRRSGIAETSAWSR